MTMTLYAYLLVSTDMQDVNNQKLGVLEYLAAQKLDMADMVSDTIRGKVDSRQRKIGKLLEYWSSGDVLVATTILCPAYSFQRRRTNRAPRLQAALSHIATIASHFDNVNLQ